MAQNSYSDESLIEAYSLGGDATSPLENLPGESQRRLLIMPLVLGHHVDALRIIAAREESLGVRAAAVQGLARLAEPTDEVSYKELVQLARSKEPSLIDAVARNLRSDCPSRFARQFERAFRRVPASSVGAVVAWKLSLCDGDAEEYLRWLSKAGVRHALAGLALLRGRGIVPTAAAIPARWSSTNDVSVIESLALLYEPQPDNAPLWLWVRCAYLCEDLYRCREPLLRTAAKALESRRLAKSATSDGADRDKARLVEALDRVVHHLSRQSHSSYLELHRAQLTPGARSFSPERAASLVQELPLEEFSPYASLWLALVRFVEPSPEQAFRLQPSHK